MIQKSCIADEWKDKAKFAGHFSARVGVQLVSALHMLWTFRCNMVVHSCETFGGIICITRLDKSGNYS